MPQPSMKKGDSKRWKVWLWVTKGRVIRRTLTPILAHMATAAWQICSSLT